MYTIKNMNQGSTREHVYQLLRNQILELQLEPGANLSEKEISEKFQISRTPVREAFLKLSQEGLLEVYPQRGTYVSLIDLGLVEEARFMREQLERAIVKLACENFPEDKIFSLALQRSLKTVDKLLKLVYAESGIRSLGTSKTGRMQHVRLLDKPAAYCREVERLSTSFIRLG